MTDLPLKREPGPGRGLRLALAVSVALNLAVLGVVGGAMLRHDGPRGPAMPRDLGFGVFTEALTPDNRAELRRTLRASAPDFVRERRAMAQDLAEILTALRAEPFDAAALDRAMGSQIDRLAARLETGQGLLRQFLTDLPAAERLAFADRLEQAALRPASRRRRAGGDPVAE